MKTLTHFIIIICMFCIFQSNAQDTKRVILFTIDGLHWQAPDKISMPHFNSLKDHGTYIQKSYVLIPHHPTIGDYSQYNSCSFPNPVLHSGSIFISPDNKYLQEMAPENKKTAFVVNTQAYKSVARGFDILLMDGSLSDEEVMQKSIKVLQKEDPSFIRIHLQLPGEHGRSVSTCDPKESYYRDIYGKDSPYIQSIENADKLLGELVSYLKKSDKWESSVLIITSDHGQSKIGWHAMLDEDSWVTPMIFAGKGIAKGRTLPYFEHTDLAPTIAMLLAYEPPTNNGGSGREIRKVLANTIAKDFQHQGYTKTINEQIKEYNILKSKLTIAIDTHPEMALLLASLENENITPEPFYHQDRIMEWHRSQSTQHMIEANEKILEWIKDILEKQ